jgi:tyrosine-protein phosphatase 2/3
MQAFSLASTASGSRPTSLPGTAAGSNSAGTPQSARGPTASNPFFDNIRQNIELAGSSTPTKPTAASSIPLVLPPAVRDHVDRLPLACLRTLAQRAISARDEVADELAQQFVDIERAEQKRLMGVMAHHAKESTSANAAFAFGITAGFEKGGKNRWADTATPLGAHTDAAAAA